MPKLSIRMNRTRWPATIAMVAVVAALAVACGPEPTPTPSPTPTATPTPTQPPSEQPAGNLEDFVITPASTGQDLLDRISEAERECLRNAFGEAVYGIMSAVPLLQEDADPAQAAPLIGCLRLDNTVLFGVAYLDAVVGGWTPGTRACMTAVAREHPEAVFRGLGLEPPTEVSAGATQPYLLQIYACMNDVERVQYLIRVQAAADAKTSVEANIVGVVPVSEGKCIRGALSSAEYIRLLQSTVSSAFLSSTAVSDCISEESYGLIFTSINDTLIEGLSETTRSCLTDFLQEHPDYAALVNPAAYDLSALSPDRMASIAEAGLRVWVCLNEDEVQRMQKVNVRALSPVRPPS